MVHSFSIELAKLYGVEKAILLHNIYFWLVRNANNGVNINDGHIWTYNSSRSFAELFPYMSDRSISRHLKWLVDNGVLLDGNYNEDKRDRTKWFAFTPEFIKVIALIGYNVSALQIENNTEEHSSKEVDAFTKNGITHSPKMDNAVTRSGGPLPYINNTDINNIYFKKDSDKSLSKKECVSQIENSKIEDSHIEDNPLNFKEEKSSAKKEENIADFKEFWDLYDKKVGNKEKILKKWLKLNLKDRSAIMEYLPKYIEATPDKKYRKNPETFLNNRAWEDEIIRNNTNNKYEKRDVSKFYDRGIVYTDTID